MFWASLQSLQWLCSAETVAAMTWHAQHDRSTFFFSEKKCQPSLDR